MDPRKEIYHWKGKGEVDFLVKEDNEVTQLIQVVYEGLDVADVLQREISSLKEGGDRYKSAEKILVAGHVPVNFEFSEKGIRLIPLWKFLLTGK